MRVFIKKNKIFLLPVLSGMLLILAYPPYDLEFLTWVALIPLFWFIALKKISLKQAMISGFITGILFFGKLFSWLFATYPFEWLGITAKTNAVLIFGLVTIFWLIQIIFLGLFVAVFAWLLKLIINKLPKFIFLIIIPAIWIVLEYARAWGFGFLWIGNESFLGPHWTFGNLAYTLHNSSQFIQLADIAGIYGISFLVVFINTILFLILRELKLGKIFKKESNLISIIILNLLLVLVASSWASYGIYKLKSDFHKNNANEAKIALLQTNFASRNEFNSYKNKEVLDTILNLLKSPEFQSNNPDFIIMPEGFGIISLIEDNNLVKYMLGDSWRPGQIYLENQKILDENEKIKSRLLFYDLEKEELIGFHDKVLLVPNGDYLPYIAKIFLKLYSFDIQHEQKLYQKGDKIEPTKTPKGIIGGTVCSSVISPYIHREMTNKGADFLVVVSSDAPFHGSISLLTQNLAMSKLRAVENRRYLAQATNMGYSFLINPKGKISVKNNELGNKILFANIQFIEKKTIYAKSGDWLIILSTIVLLLIFILCYNKKVLKFIKKLSRKTFD